MMRRALLMLTVAVAGCNTPDSFYNKLGNILQFVPLTNNYYAVGDTLVLLGKLGGPNGGLTVTIGGVNAPVISLVEVPSYSHPTSGTTYNESIDSARVVVTAAMGIGANRQVIGTLHGVQREAGLIFISLVRPVPLRTDTLSYDSSAVSYTIPGAGGDTLVARGDNGDGRVYILAGDSLELWQSGVRSLLHAGLEDQYGPFHNIGASGAMNTFMAVDAAGHYLYASLITSDTTAASATNLIFRLIKVDLQAFTIQTLNRTVFPINQTVTPAYAASLTMTGPVGSVFLMPLSQLFPGKDGSIYFVADGLNLSQTGNYWQSVYYFCTTPNIGYASAVGKIDPTGNVSYLIKVLGCGLVIKTTQGFMDLLPTLNTTHDWSWIDVIDPDSGVVYASGAGVSVSGVAVPAALATIAYDLKRQRILGTFAPPQLNNFNSTNVSGPFDAVDGPFGIFGLVAGGGHRLWAQADKNAATPCGCAPSLLIIDFDLGLVSPYVALRDWVPAQTSYANQSYASYFPAFVNHMANGDPLVAAQGYYGSSAIVPPSNVGAAAAARCRVARRGRR